MKNFRTIAASMTTAAALTGTMLAAPLATAQDQTIHGYTVSVDKANQTCTVTPTKQAYTDAATYRAQAWPDAERAIDSFGLSYTQQYKEQIAAAIDEGARSTDTAIMTPLAAIEAITVVTAAKTANDLISAYNSFAKTLNLPTVSPNTEESLALTIIRFGLSAFNTENLMQPGELSDTFVNPAVDVSSPFVPAEGQEFKFADATKQAEEYQNKSDNPVWANASINTIVRSDEAKAQVAQLSNGFKTSLKTYNANAAEVFAACAGEPVEPTQPEGPTKPVDPQDPTQPADPKDPAKPEDPKTQPTQATAGLMTCRRTCLTWRPAMSVLPLLRVSSLVAWLQSWPLLV